MSQTKTNFPTFDQLAEMNESQWRELSLDTLHVLAQDIEERNVALIRDNAILDMVKLAKFPPDEAYKKAGQDTGKLTVAEADGYVVTVERKKMVTWDQKFLAELYGVIAKAGDAPELYIKREETVAYKVSEAAFKTWPSNVQEAFTPGRTVKPSKAVITITPKKEG